MALTGDDEREVIGLVCEFLLADVAEDLHTYYAEVVATAHRHPEQANKELRDAVTHLGRALAATEISVAKSQIGQAKRHIERAKRDCLKMSLIFVSDRLARLCHEIVVEHGQISANFIHKRRELRVRRREVATAEAAGNDAQLTLRMFALLNDYSALEEELIAQYSMPDPRISWYKMPWRYVKSFWRRMIVPTIFGLVVGIVGTLLAATLVPDQASFGKSVQSKIKKMVVQEEPSASSASDANQSEKK